MKAVLDTGIFISALISSQGTPFKAVELWIDKRFDLVTSQYQLQELREVSRYPQVSSRVVPTEVGTLVNRLRKYGMVLDELPSVDYSPDPKDNPILATGIAGEVQYIVSGDKRDMLELEKIKGIPIISARDFVSMFMDLGG